MGGDFRQVGGDFLAKALDPEGPPPAQETLCEYEKVTRVSSSVLMWDNLPSRRVSGHAHRCAT